MDQPLINQVVKKLLDYIFIERGHALRVNVGRESMSMVYVSDGTSDPPSFADETSLLPEYCGNSTRVHRISSRELLAEFPKEIGCCRFLSAIPKICPKAFPRGTLSDFEKELFSTLSKGEGELGKANVLLDKWFTESGASLKLAAQHIADFLRSGRFSMLKIKKDKLMSIQEVVEKYREDLFQKIRELDSIKLMVEALEKAPTEIDEKALFDFISEMPEATFDKLNDDRLFVRFLVPMCRVETSLIEDMIASEKGRFYQLPYEKRDIKTFLEWVWISRKIDIMVEASFAISPPNSVKPLKSGVGRYTGQYLTNRHISSYGCTGSFEETFADIALNGDLYGALYAARECAMSLNLGDSTVLDSTVSEMIAYKMLNSYKDTETGELLTLDEVMDRIRRSREVQSEV